MRENIIFYFTDQQRADTCGCFGQPLDITPNLDTLAAGGVKFDNAFSPQPVCGPCRALFQTGKYPTETGCFRNNIMLPKNVKTLANYIEEAGYETAYIGKWHLASDGELEKPPTIDHTITAVPKELRGGYTGFWRAADVLNSPPTDMMDMCLMRTITRSILRAIVRTASQIWLFSSLISMTGKNHFS